MAALAVSLAECKGSPAGGDLGSLVRVPVKPG